ncbi:class I SAM-dependent methyltransferase [Candidatus Marsarchaeota archaeon]|jgi:SAM-dependent methyltransferase|nr:class I SAM-dependent methyltransferase [Candidatus Marsarchaeota archaeon]MCL5092367.1 class I SAM-dependent methyltransferase [Candidatus Marsarchaeota archaeon]
MRENIEDLQNKYPWLKVTNSLEEYVEPNYYNKILKDYIFDGKSDINIFEDFLKKINLDKGINALNALELGCGTGRATKVFVNSVKAVNFTLDLVDLSSRMLDFSKKEFKDYENIKFFESDSMNFLEKMIETYDIIFSLWSFSHSVHQNLIKKGLYDGKKYVQEVISKMIKENMRANSKFFLIHFDSMSDEQRILMKQGRKVFSIYNDLDKQSPSKLIIDEVLNKLNDDGTIKLKANHFVGEAITYSSLNEALEVFLNFHMESYFNKTPELQTVIQELSDYFKNFTGEDGKIRIKPGCFTYEVEKI